MTTQRRNYRSPADPVNKHRRRGIALIWVVIMSTVLLGIVGLAIDTARVLLVSHELQNAADAAALSGRLSGAAQRPLHARSAVIATAGANWLR